MSEDIIQQAEVIVPEKPEHDPEFDEIELVDNEWFVKPIVQVPASIRIEHLKSAIMEGGNLNEFEFAMESLPEPERSIAKHRWRKRSSCDRNWSIFSQLEQILDWRPSVLNRYFRLALIKEFENERTDIS